MDATYPLCMLYIPSDFLRKYIFFHTFLFKENNDDGEKKGLDSEIGDERDFFVWTRDKYRRCAFIKNKEQINNSDCFLNME